MTQTINPDICVIGGGPGGLTAAALAASFGVSVTLVERARLGGARLNSGCVESKALLAVAQRAHDIRTAGRFGLRGAEPGIDHRAVSAHIAHIVSGLSPNDSPERLNGLGVEVLKAEARFADRDTVAAGDRLIRARRFIIATGSSPSIPPIPGLSRVTYFTSDTVFGYPHRFAHLLIVGGAPWSYEMAQAYRRLGSDVTLLDGGSALSRDDPEMRQHLVKALRDEGVRILENARVERVEPFGSNIQLVFQTLGKSYSIEGSDLLLATGRTPAIANLNLEAARIKFKETGISVNSGLRTSNKRVYAIGDVTGAMPYTHVANYHASLAVRSALFRLPVRARHETMPWVTFTDPELAHVGTTEDVARARFKKLRILRWPYHENDRAHATGRASGFLKVIASTKGEILGAGLVGANAGEIIQMWSLAIQKGIPLHRMAEIVSPYPTMSEINKKAAVSFVSTRAGDPLLRRIAGFLARFP